MLTFVFAFVVLFDKEWRDTFINYCYYSDKYGIGRGLIVASLTLGTIPAIVNLDFVAVLIQAVLRILPLRPWAFDLTCALSQYLTMKLDLAEPATIVFMIVINLIPALITFIILQWSIRKLFSRRTPDGVEMSELSWSKQLDEKKIRLRLKAFNIALYGFIAMQYSMAIADWYVFRD